MTTGFTTATQTQAESASAAASATALPLPGGEPTAKPFGDLFDATVGTRVTDSAQLVGDFKAMTDTAPTMTTAQAQQRLASMESIYSDPPQGVEMYTLPETEGGVSAVQGTVQAAVGAGLVTASTASYVAAKTPALDMANPSAMQMFGRGINESKFSAGEVGNGLSRAKSSVDTATRSAASTIKADGVTKAAGKGLVKGAKSTASAVKTGVSAGTAQVAKQGAVTATKAGAKAATMAGVRVVGRTAATMAAFPIGTVIGVTMLAFDPMIIGAVRGLISRVQGHSTPSLESLPSWEEGLHYLTLTGHEKRDTVIRSNDAELYEANTQTFNYPDEGIWHPTAPDIAATSDFAGYFELFAQLTDLIGAAGEETLRVLSKYQDDPYIGKLSSERSNYVASIADMPGEFMNPVALATADTVVAFASAYTGLRDAIFKSRYEVSVSDEPDTALWGMAANPFFSMEVDTANLTDTAEYLRLAATQMMDATAALESAGSTWSPPTIKGATAAAGLTAHDLKAAEEISRDPAGYLAKFDIADAEPGDGLDVDGLDVDGLDAPDADGLLGGLDTPEVPTPGLAAPRISAPNLTAPGITSPSIASPNLGGAGGLSTPNLGGPGGLSTPDLKPPTLKTPDLGSVGSPGGLGGGGLTSPSAGAPQIKTPDLGGIKSPSLKTPDLKAPDLGGITPPSLKTPDLSGAGAPGASSPGNTSPSIPDLKPPTLKTPDLATNVSGVDADGIKSPGAGLPGAPGTSGSPITPTTPGKLDPANPSSPLTGDRLGNALRNPSDAANRPGASTSNLSTPKTRDEQKDAPAPKVPGTDDAADVATPGGHVPDAPTVTGGGGGFTAPTVTGGGFAAPSGTGGGGPSLNTASLGGTLFSGGDAPGTDGGADAGAGDATPVDGEIDPNDPAANPEGGDGEATREPTAITRDGQVYEMGDTKAAKMAELLNPSDGTPGMSLREAAAEAGFKVPPAGFDIGSPISPADIQPGDVIIGDGVEGVYVGDGLVLTKDGLIPLSEAAVFVGANQGIFRLDGNMAAEDSLATGQDATAEGSFVGGPGQVGSGARAASTPGGGMPAGLGGAGNPRGATDQKSAGSSRTGDPFDPVNNNPGDGFSTLKVTGTGGVGASPFGGGGTPRVPTGD